MEFPMCMFCDNKSKYDQPDKNSGVIISVCERHFTMDLSS